MAGVMQLFGTEAGEFRLPANPAEIGNRPLPESQPPVTTIFIAHYDGPGANQEMRVFATLEGAEAYREEIARRRWDPDLHGPMPEQAPDMANAYWAAQQLDECLTIFLAELP